MCEEINLTVPSVQRAMGGGGQRGLLGANQADTHIYTEDKATQARWHHIKDVFSECVQQIQLFIFFLAISKSYHQIFRKMGFVPVAMVTGLVSTVGRGEAGGRVHISDVHNYTEKQLW